MKKTYFLVAPLIIGLAGCQCVDASNDKNEAHKAKNFHEAQLERAVASKRFMQENKPEQVLWTQPVNQKDSCALPALVNGRSDNGIRIYWDGACRDGKAFGLGRKLAIMNGQVIQDVIYDFKSNEKKELFADFLAWEVDQNRFQVGSMTFPDDETYQLKRFYYRFIPTKLNTWTVIAATEVADHTHAWFRAVFKSSANIRTTTYFNHDRGVVDTMNVASNDHSPDSYWYESYDRNTNQKLTPAYLRIFGPDWEKELEMKTDYSTKYPMPEGYWTEFAKKFEPIKRESESIIRDSDRFGKKAHLYVKTFCNQSKIAPQGLNAAQYELICRLNPNLFKVGFNQLLLQNPDRYPIYVTDEENN